MASFMDDRPLVSDTKFDIYYQTASDGADVYGTAVTAGASCWVLGSTLRARAIGVTVRNFALTGAPTGLKVGLYEGTDSSGTGAAVVTGSETEFLTPAANTTRQATIDLSKLTISSTKYYSVGITLNGSGSTSTPVGTASVFLDADQVS